MDYANPSKKLSYTNLTGHWNIPTLHTPYTKNLSLSTILTVNSKPFSYKIPAIEFKLHPNFSLHRPITQSKGSRFYSSIKIFELKFNFSRGSSIP
jgi:hypothetical protein